MFRYVLYVINLLRLRLFGLKINKSRFDCYTPVVDDDEFERNGLVDSDESWQFASPNLKNAENVTIFASNSSQSAAVSLTLKWRPSQEDNLATLLTQFSLEANDCILDYDHVATYVPQLSSLRPTIIEQYGSNLSALKLFIESPYTRYRLVFCGYMRERANPLGEPKLVKLNLSILACSKPNDYLQQFSDTYVAQQVAVKQPKCGLHAALDSLICSDRQEFTVELKGEYSIKEASSAKSGRIHAWGFYNKRMLDDKTSVNKLRSKQLFCYFGSGKNFHLGCVESIENNFDKSMRMDFGFAAINPVKTFLLPIDVYNESYLQNWDKLTSDTRQIDEFTVHAKETIIKVTATKRSSNSQFFAASATDNVGRQHKGWLVLTINDSLDGAEDVRQISRSLSDYKQQLESEQVLDAVKHESAEQACLAANADKPLVVSMSDDLDKFACKNLVGAKASSLALMKRRLKGEGKSAEKTQVEVPTAIALTQFAYQMLSDSNEELKSNVRQLTAQVGQGNNSLIGLTCERLQSLITDDGTQLPEALVDELKLKLKSTFSVLDLSTLDDRAFAVRSSSWGEDEDGMSAAGQLTTVLNVRSLDKLLAAVKQCFASKFSATNIEYKQQHGLPLDMPMAVVVQEMIACEKAGVVFTCDPTTGNGRYMTVTANYGLGESVVSAAADPDTIVVDVHSESAEKRVEIVSKHIGKKDVVITDEVADVEAEVVEKKVVADESTKQATPENDDKENVNPDANHKTTTTDQKTAVEKQAPVKKAAAATKFKLDKTVCCLNDAQILALVDHALELRRFFQSERDIEFGFKGETLYLFQSRPVTGFDALTDYELLHFLDSGARSEVDFLTRANSGEVLPYPITPMTSSLFLPLWFLSIDKLMYRWNKIDLEHYTPRNPLGHRIEAYHFFTSLIEGEVYTGVQRNVAEKSLPQRAVEISLFGYEIDDKELNANVGENARLKSGLTGFPVNFYTLPIRLRLFNHFEETRKYAEKTKNEIDASEDQTPSTLFDQVKVVSEVSRSMIDHFIVLLIGTEMNLKLLLLLSKYIKEPSELFVALSKFLALSPNVLSAEIPARIEAMANVIKRRGKDESIAFSKLPTNEALKYVTSPVRIKITNQDIKDESNTELAKMFDEFMEYFGHRLYNEYELAAVTWRDNPGEIIDKIQLICSSPIVKPARQKQTLDELIESLNIKFSYFDKLRIKRAAKQCQLYVTARERTKDNVIFAVSILRDALTKLAASLQKYCRIPDKNLLFYFTLSEIQYLILDHQPKLVTQARNRRRICRASFKQEWRFEKIIKGCEFVPLHLIKNDDKSNDAKHKDSLKLIGTTACAGRVEGLVCIVEDFTQLHKVTQDCILVTHSTDIAFSTVFPILAGLVTEVGGLISHGAVVAREYGLPCIIGIADATKILKHGQKVILDANQGCVIVE